MKITVKLYATLGEYLPPGSEHNVSTLDIHEGATVQDVIQHLKLPSRMTHLVLVNGEYVEPSGRSKLHLKACDALAIWPPIAGG